MFVEKHKNLSLKILVILCALILYQGNITVYAEPELYNEVWQQQKTILLDAGHGGIDGGGSSKKGVLEKDINLTIAKKTKELLEKEGYTVIMTREEDKGLYTDNGRIRKKHIEDINNRLKMKKECGCDMFISIHLNIFPETQYRGAQVWYGDNDQSQKLAQLLQQNFRDNLDKSNNRKAKPAGQSYKVLTNNGNIAAVIVECGFLSNPEEADLLSNAEYQHKIADTITQTANAYFGMHQ